ncbi:hypothetical protein P9112_011069 [Eukaryota sp. TZLM1-RC]
MYDSHCQSLDEGPPIYCPPQTITYEDTGTQTGINRRPSPVIPLHHQTPQYCAHRRDVGIQTGSVIREGAQEAESAVFGAFNKFQSSVGKLAEEVKYGLGIKRR